MQRRALAPGLAAMAGWLPAASATAQGAHASRPVTLVVPQAATRQALVAPDLRDDIARWARIVAASGAVVDRRR